MCGSTRSPTHNSHAQRRQTHIHISTRTPLSGPNNHFINSLHWFQFKPLQRRTRFGHGENGSCGGPKKKSYTSNYRQSETYVEGYNTKFESFFLSSFNFFFFGSSSPSLTLLYHTRVICEFVIVSFNRMYFFFFISHFSLFLFFFVGKVEKEISITKIWWIVSTSFDVGPLYTRT